MKILHQHTAFLTLILCLSAIMYGQENNGVLSSGTRIVTDAGLGISFSVTGAAVKTDGETYHIDLPVQNAYAEVSASARPFIDLPGSYGGRLFLDSPDAVSIIERRIFVDTLRIESSSFRREYWTVYAGMGMWDCVIRCASIGNSNTVCVMLVQQMAAGKPGESGEHTPLTTESISKNILLKLQDPKSETISSFNALLSSVRFTAGAKEVR